MPFHVINMRFQCAHVANYPAAIRLERAAHMATDLSGSAHVMDGIVLQAEIQELGNRH
jgi:hypothetical protein